MPLRSLSIQLHDPALNHLRRGEYETALQALGRLVRLVPINTPESADSRNALALACTEAGHVADAVAIASRTIAITPTHLLDRHALHKALGRLPSDHTSIARSS